MQHRFSFRHSKLTSRACFFTILLFCLALVGCSNYCFVFVSNPGGSISTSSNTPSCQLNTATGTVSLRVTASPTSSAQATPLPTTIQHIFVTLRGIEATPSTIPNDDSPNWRELAPQLASQPEQLDLLAQCAESCEQNTFGDVAVPADAYRQIRLRLSPNQPATDEPLPEENACGSAGFSCVITADGVIRPLVLDILSSQFQISSDHISGGFIQVLPDAAINLNIEFNPQSSLFFPVNNAVRLVPTFTVVPQASSESTAALNQ
ncbi:MAG: DUF4382 domain-containing protein [Candidatus Acidiferrales bacterium]|jgi:hypothetical protein